MNARPVLVLAAVAVGALVLTRPRPAPAPANPNTVPGPYAALRPSGLVLAPNRAVDPWRTGTIPAGG